MKIKPTRLPESTYVFAHEVLLDGSALIEEEVKKRLSEAITKEIEKTLNED